jgi:glutamyl-tRNA synthetase
MLDRDEIDALFPNDLPEASHWEHQYPPRRLSLQAQVTRFCPSPTGSLHLGGIFVAMLDQAIARQSGGIYLVRIEDTDQEREIAGAVGQFSRALEWYDLSSDESEETGQYGPYVQSRRSEIYLTYVRDFLRAGKAYLCFCTRADLAKLAEEQRAANVSTGYYGNWAPWRDAPDELVRQRLLAGDPYVVRFRSPGAADRQVEFRDAIRGRIALYDNRNDIVILKSSENALPLPTYHFAHVVDDHLMRVNLVIRGEEWIPSVPVHLQLFDAAGFESVAYAHVAPLMKRDGSSRRKLSKRRDPEASIEFYMGAGYPQSALIYFLRGLANSRLSYMPIGEELKEPLRLKECGVAGPLIDLAKLDDIAANVIAEMTSEDIIDKVGKWASIYDVELAAVVAHQRALALRVLGIDRAEADHPRKDLKKWSDFRRVYGYFFNTLFQPITDTADSRFGNVPHEAVRALASLFAHKYHGWTDPDQWFDQIRVAGVTSGFAPTVRAFKDAPSSYIGSIREASQIIRVLLTGGTNSPPLHLIANALGDEEVRHRVNAVLSSTH